MNEFKKTLGSILLHLFDIIDRLNHYDYRLLKWAYIEYHSTVKLQLKSYDIYVFEQIQSLNYRLDTEKKKSNDESRIIIIKKLILFFEKKQEIVENYFKVPNFDLMKAKEMIAELDNSIKLYSEKHINILNPKIAIKQNIDTRNQILQQSVEEAKRYLKTPNSTSHMATRIGGYLYRNDYIDVKSIDELILKWSTLVKYEIGDAYYLNKPGYIKSSKHRTIESLSFLYFFFESIEAHDICKEIKNDIQSTDKTMIGKSM